MLDCDAAGMPDPVVLPVDAVMPSQGERIQTTRVVLSDNSN